MSEGWLLRKETLSCRSSESGGFDYEQLIHINDCLVGENRVSCTTSIYFSSCPGRKAAQRLEVVKLNIMIHWFPCLEMRVASLISKVARAFSLSFMILSSSRWLVVSHRLALVR